MKELEEYREKLLTRLEQAASEFRTACLAARDPYAPLEQDGWSVHQIAVHTRDVDRLAYGERARRTLAEPGPTFSNFDGDAYMLEHYRRDEPLPAVLDGLATGIHSLVQMLRAMPVSGWSRESSHETQGSGITLQTWVERGLDHIEEHLARVRQAAG